MLQNGPIGVQLQRKPAKALQADSTRRDEANLRQIAYFVRM